MKFRRFINEITPKYCLLTLHLADKPINTNTTSYIDIMRKEEHPKFITDDELRTFCNQDDQDLLEFLRLLQPNEQQAQEIFKNIFVLNRLKLNFKE